MAKAKSHKFGSKEWYKDQIRQMLPNVNLKFSQARNNGTMNEQLAAVEKRLINYGGNPSIVGKHRDETIGLGFHKKPSKGMLKRQYGELKRITEKDIWSPSGIEKEIDREENAYQSFVKFHPGWSKEKWIDFVELLGNAPTELLQAFTYERSDSHKGSKTKTYNPKNEGFIEAFSAAYEKDVDLFRVMERTYASITSGNGKGLSQEKALDMLKEEIKKELGNDEEEET